MKGRWERRWKAKSRRESRRKSCNTHHADDTCMKCAPHTLFLSQCQRDTQMCAVQHEKMWRVRCAVHTLRRLQQIAISCKRSDYNKLNKILSKCHCEQLSEEAASTGRPVLWCRSFLELRGNWHWWILWAPPVIVPLPPWCAGWRRRRLPFLILVERNRCRSLFSRLTVKTVHIC